MPRHKDAVPSVEWKLHISVEVAAQVQLLLTDPLRKKVRYGARSDLTEQLYKRWITEQLRERILPEEEPPPPADPAVTSSS